MQEIWKDIKDYEGLYQVSNFGRVRSLEHEVKYINGYSKIHKGIIRNPIKMGKSYLSVKLCINSKKKNYYIHKLVAEAFIDNPNNYVEINHKDENKHNNNVNNLEWCNHKYNMNYGTRTERAKQKQQLNKLLY